MEERRARMVKLQEAYKTAKRHSDFRKMLEQQKDIDAIIVATPDHLHAVIAKTAMELGKHAYVEKPLTWSVQEARVLRETAARKKVVTQMGNMGHSSEGAALVNEWVQAGVIGPVREVHVWTNRPLGFWPQGVPRPGKLPAPAEAGGPGERRRGQAAGQPPAPPQRSQPAVCSEPIGTPVWLTKRWPRRWTANTQRPPGWSGISFSARRPKWRTIRSTIRSTGAGGWIGAQARSATWPLT